MQNIVDIAANRGRFKILLEAVEKTGLMQTLRGPGPLTLLAPTDIAFDLLPPAAVQTLFHNTAKLKSIVEYHIVPGRILFRDALKLKAVSTLQGSTMRSISLNGLKVNNASITEPDIEASNGMIHIIDRVLVPV